MNSEQALRLKYVVADYLASTVAWNCYNCLRYALGAVHGQASLASFMSSRWIVVGDVVFPLMMMCVYWLSGYYNNVFRRSRLQELLVTLESAAVNTLLIFFVALINDVLPTRRGNYEIILVLLLLLFAMTYAVRAVITSGVQRRIRRRQLTFATMVVGAGKEAVRFVNRMEQMPQSMGYDVRGYVAIPGEHDCPHPGKQVYQLEDLPQLCQRERIKELIVVPTRHSQEQLLRVVNRLFALNLPIKITPDRYNVLRSRVRLNDIYGDPLIDISGSSMSEGEKNVKRLIDMVVAGIMLLLLLPVYAIVAAIIKIDSKGPAFYSQERVGMHNKPFMIRKFRTMVCNAEVPGKPQLSSESDPRITRVGHVLRKYRIDELPQFWNVLRGDMSLVGPRPERKHFVELILQHEPAYSLVHQIRPGITSMGMVKFGYASNLDEMLRRVEYDLLYLENMSLFNDLKILIYTVKIVITGKGV